MEMRLNTRFVFLCCLPTLAWSGTTSQPGAGVASTTINATEQAEWAALAEILRSCNPSWSFLFPYDGPFPCRADFSNPNDAWGAGDKLVFLALCGFFWALMCGVVHFWPRLSAVVGTFRAKGSGHHAPLEVDSFHGMETPVGIVPPYPADKRVVELFEQQVRGAPGAPALVVPGLAGQPKWEMSYAQVDAAAEEVCTVLLSAGISTGAVAALVLHRSVAQVVAVYGVLKSGAAFLPIDADAPLERMQLLLAESEALVVIGAAGDGGVAERAAVASGCPNYLALPCDGALGRVALRRLVSPSAVVGVPARGAPVANEALPRGRPSEDDMALLIYTSGTTGAPKGIVYDHRFLTHGVHFFAWHCQMDAQSIALLKSPYIWAIVEYELFPALTCGGRLVVASADGHKSPEYLANTISAHQVSTLLITPQVLDLILDIHEARGRVRPLASLSHIVTVGDALPSSVATRTVRALEARLHNFYGATESSCALYTVPREGVDLVAFPNKVPAGTPQPHVTVYVMQAVSQEAQASAALTRVPTGEAGEICFGGVLAARYWKQNELTAQKWVHTEQYGVLYRTGDLGRWRAGQLEVLGRTDRQVKVRGVRVEPEEVEAVLRQYEACAGDQPPDLEDGEGAAACVVAMRAALKEVAVVASKEPAELVAFVSARDGFGEVSVEGLRAHCQAKLAPPYVPKFYAVVPELPKLPNGKPDLAELRERATQHAAEEGDLVMDSLGQMKKLSKWAMLENDIIHRCYAYWMLGVLVDHYMRCSADFFNGGTAPFCTILSRTNVKPWTEALVRAVGNDQDMFGFIMLGAYQDARPARPGAPPRVNLGLKDVFIFAVYMMMALPLPQLVYYLTGGWAWPLYWGDNMPTPQGIWGWDAMRRNGQVSGHRWYLLMVVEARVFMQMCEKLRFPGWLQVILWALPIVVYQGKFALDFCQDHPDSPTSVLYLFAWVFTDTGDWCPAYWRWAQIYGVFYVFCFHYLRFLVDTFQQRVPRCLRTSTWGAIAASTSMMIGIAMALFHYPNEFMEIGTLTSWAWLEVAVNCLQPSLLAIGMAFLPMKLSWWGNTTLGSFVFHYYFRDQMGLLAWKLCDAVAWDPTGILAFVLIMLMCLCFTTFVGPAGHYLLLSPVLLHARIRRSPWCKFGRVKAMDARRLKG